MTALMLKAGLLCWWLPLTYLVPHPLSLAVMLAILFTDVRAGEDGSLTISLGD